jgi:hypothetical protein
MANLTLLPSELGVLDLTGLFGLVRKAWTFWTGRNDSQFREARDEEFRQWTVEHALALYDLLRRIGAAESDVAALRAKLEKLADDREFQRVQGNYGWEAWREATDERRRMLSFAAAGSYTIELSVAQLARVERTVRELDPADLRLLRELNTTAFQAPQRLTEPPDGDDDPRLESYRKALGAATQRFAICELHQPSGHVLVASACVSVEFPVHPFVGPAAYVTDLGRSVLQVLDCYLRAQHHDEPTPPQRPVDDPHEGVTSI